MAKTYCGYRGRGCWVPPGRPCGATPPHCGYGRDGSRTVLALTMRGLGAKLQDMPLLSTTCYTTNRLGIFHACL